MPSPLRPYRMNPNTELDALQGLFSGSAGAGSASGFAGGMAGMMSPGNAHTEPITGGESGGGPLGGPSGLPALNPGTNFAAQNDYGFSYPDFSAWYRQNNFRVRADDTAAQTGLRAQYAAERERARAEYMAKWQAAHPESSNLGQTQTAGAYGHVPTDKEMWNFRSGQFPVGNKVLVNPYGP